MDAKTPTSLSEPYLPLNLPRTTALPRGVDSELWRIAHHICPPGAEVSLTDFGAIASVVARYFKTRSMPSSDAAAWLQRYGESRHLPERFGADNVQLALAVAFDNAYEEEDPGREERPPEFSDDALAVSFTQRHRNDLRHVAVWAHWLTYDGTVWRLDETYYAFHLARLICREAAAINQKASVRTALASGKTFAAVERIAKTDPVHATTVEQWDANPMLLNTPRGVIDLCTGSLRPSSPHDYMTKITAAAPGGNCPIWESFLARITNNDAELVKFLQRVLGYCLTGSTREHGLFFLYGTGANGKSVLINTVTEILAGYHKTASIETFTASKFERHPTDIAGLRGARMVTAVETEEGRHWAEAKIKALTGGDKISARFMRADPFEFTPQLKLVIAGNHKPSLKSVDEAIRRRFHLIPFVVTIPPKERDKELTEKLKAEWSGILSWMIEGCLAWQRDGLCPPAVVVDATEDYMDAEDTFANWIADCCERDPRSFTNSSVLFESYKAWALCSGENAGPEKNFRTKLEGKGFRYQRLGKAAGGRGYHGIKLVKHGHD
jgi:putative DNA primase/helicase